MNKNLNHLNELQLTYQSAFINQLPTLYNEQNTIKQNLIQINSISGEFQQFLRQKINPNFTLDIEEIAQKQYKEGMSIRTINHNNSQFKQNYLDFVSEKIQIPKLRGNLSSFNDPKNINSMKQESNALNNLRNMSEDKHEKLLSNIDNMDNKDSNKKLTQFKTTQSYLKEKRKDSLIAGWDNDASFTDDQDLKNKDEILSGQQDSEYSNQVQRQNQFEKQLSPRKINNSHKQSSQSPVKKSSCDYITYNIQEASNQMADKYTNNDQNSSSSSPKKIRRQTSVGNISKNNKSAQVSIKNIKFRPYSAMPKYTNNLNVSKRRIDNSQNSLYNEQDQQSPLNNKKLQNQVQYTTKQIQNPNIQQQNQIYQINNNQVLQPQCINNLSHEIQIPRRPESSQRRKYSNLIHNPRLNTRQLNKSQDLNIKYNQEKSKTFFPQSDLTKIRNEGDSSSPLSNELLFQSDEDCDINTIKTNSDYQQSDDNNTNKQINNKLDLRQQIEQSFDQGFNLINQQNKSENRNISLNNYIQTNRKQVQRQGISPFQINNHSSIFGGQLNSVLTTFQRDQGYLIDQKQVKNNNKISNNNQKLDRNQIMLRKQENLSKTLTNLSQTFINMFESKKTNQEQIYNIRQSHQQKIIAKNRSSSLHQKIQESSSKQQQFNDYLLFQQKQSNKPSNISANIQFQINQQLLDSNKWKNQNMSNIYSQNSSKIISQKYSLKFDPSNQKKLSSQ